MPRRLHARALLALTALVIGASLPPAIMAQASTPERDLLHELADLNRAVALLAHETMHRPGTFPSKAQATAVDKRHDDDMDHMSAALKTLGDDYKSRASGADSATAKALSKLSGAAYDAEFRKDVTAIDERAIKAVDSYTPKLTNVLIKTLAGRMRASAAAEMKELAGG